MLISYETPIDFRGLGSSRSSRLRRGIPRSVGNLPEIWSQRFLICKSTAFAVLHPSISKSDHTLPTRGDGISGDRPEPILASKGCTASPPETPSSQRERERERERETTLESHDCPVWCAAPTGSRLPSQAPAAPQSFDPGEGGPTAPPSWGKERTNPG